ncbi:Histone acetyltransferase type b catalytic subunit [Thalictrum thalictroides]|uniref:histone acetyltransferase n=1 Tax=Thalictrum thalictroides TaxID=46969 RepID=A0A7J6X5E5_THATH|nr:Histone acetyltransferase type b catalytic subunit [Thalictrum thalictroides]
MGLKQALTDPNSDPKKRRRVGFSSIDVGVEANECIKIFLVNCKEEVGVEDSFQIDPIDLNQFFDEDGKIFGYKNLKINIFLSTISFHAYADITFESSSDGGKGITDLKPALQKILGESLVEDKEEFLQTFSAGIDYIRNVMSNGEVLHREATTGDNKSNNQLEAESFTVEHQVIRMAVNSMSVGELYCRLVPLVLLLVDGSSPIDVTDPRWEIYLAVESKSNDQGVVGAKLLGFAAVYRFYYYPESSRLRISQVLVLPPYQGKGHGHLLLKVLNSVALSENVYDVTVEEPSDYLQHVRTCVDMHRLLDFEPIKQAISSVALHLKQGNLSKKPYKLQSDPPASAVEDVRRSLKINKKQFLQCWEILIYLELDHSDSNCMENYRTLITDRTRNDILGKDTGAAEKQLIEVPNDYDHEMTFVVFCPSDNVKVENINTEAEGNQDTREEQLKQLVDERMKEITEVAQKISLKRQ